MKVIQTIIETIACCVLGLGLIVCMNELRERTKRTPEEIKRDRWIDAHDPRPDPRN